MPTIEQLQVLLAEDPEDVFLNFGLALQFSKEERHSESLTHFDRVIELDPGYFAAYHQKALSLVRLRRVAEAQAALTTGMELASGQGDRHAHDNMRVLLESISAG
ncbi:MAG: hypothetical protein GY842_04830 [bacterium]|nr:hypothetical protein [bacterium]